MVAIHEQVTRYAISVFPEEHELRRHFTINVEYRGRGLWVVLYGGSVIGCDGSWEFIEPIPSERTVEWLARYRFVSAGDALAVARYWAPRVKCNGRTASQAERWMAKR